jgi:hypothetical protein
MQEILDHTAQEMRDNPSPCLSTFQQILSQPSYFLALPNSRSWTVLLGPRPRNSIAVIPFPPPDSATPSDAPELAIAPKIYEYIAPRTRLHTRAARFCWNTLRGLQHWLMHPVIDTRY